MTAPPQSFRKQDSSLRLIFRFEDGEYSLLRRREVAGMAPPSEPLDRGERRARSGFWVELVDPEGRALYRRVMQHPIRTRAEVPDEEGGFTNRVSVARQGTFSVLVPNLPDAAELVLFSSPLERPQAPEPAEAVVRVPVREREEEGREEPTEKRPPQKDAEAD